MKSSNPAIYVTKNQQSQVNFGGIESIEHPATISGTVKKTILLMAITIIVGYFTMLYGLDLIQAGHDLKNWGWGSVALLVIAFVGTILVAIFRLDLIHIATSVYAVFEGIFLGLIAALCESILPGLILVALFATFCVTLIMLALWKYKIIVPTSKFRNTIVGAISGISVLYLTDLSLSLFGVDLLPAGSLVTILASIPICIIAALNLILNFDDIETCVKEGLPKEYEYLTAFSLLLSICWLYMEILRLLLNLLYHLALFLKDTDLPS